MKLATILIMSFIFVGLIGSIFGTHSYYIESNALLEEAAGRNLESTAQVLENFMDKFLEEQIKKLEITATHQELSFEELRKVIDLQEYFFELFVLDSSGKVTISSDESLVGKDESDNLCFINGKDASYVKPVYFSETIQKESVTISTPFNDGVLVARMDLDGFDEILTDRTGFGNTGETLLAYYNEEGEVSFITERRFEGESFGDRGAYGDLPIEEALLGKEKIILGSFDYRNIEVLAATRHMGIIDAGLIVKVDEAEALGAARNRLIRIALINIVIMIIFVSIAGLLVSYLVSRPLRKLNEDLDGITKGKLDIQLEKSGIFEMQQLIDSLNRILASLKLAILRTGSSRKDLGLGDAIEKREEAEEKYKTLYESSRDAIMILEAPGWNFTAGNPATIKLFGAKDEKEFTSKSPRELSPERQPNGKLSSVLAKAMIMKTIKEGSSFFNWTHKRIAGEDFPATVLLTRMRLKGKDAVQATVRELSKGNKVVVKNLKPAVKKAVSKKNIDKIKEEGDDPSG